MGKSRLEAFSDGVFAIIITIMVLELKVPESDEWHALLEMWPVMLSYVISFLFIGIYWGNHHHLLHTVKQVNSGILLANLNLLFWLSLIPFATAWMGESHFTTNPVIVYAVLLLMCGFAYTILQTAIFNNHDYNGELREAFEKLKRKGLFSIISYSAAIPFAFYNTLISCCLFLLVSVVWLIPDKSIEKALKD